TAQGFEYSWNGVILGPDLVWRSTANEGTGGWVSRREYNKDPDFKSTKAVSNEAFDSLVRNVYKVLLTRGLQGTLIYSTDSETLEFLRGLTN
ncbi:DNA/RNA helicase domain-containing protein, partial [Timonella senegalensis]|uniref:DNA/RNA helicase domain-containing protein n=1 Tax=Timonella senegalensis TaxID=1465825 RepID=UPI002FDE4794